MNPRAQFWTTYQERRLVTTTTTTNDRLKPNPAPPPLGCLSADWSIEALLQRWKLSCVEVRLDTFGADRPELAGSSLPGSHSVLMMVITLKTQDGDTG